jgi:hypothetical protein
MPKYTSKRGLQDDARDALATDLSPFLLELAALWDGDGTLSVATITVTRSKQGEGALAIVKGTVELDGDDYATVAQFGGQAVIAYGFGGDFIEALCSLEVLLQRGELQLLPDRYAPPSKLQQAASRAKAPPKPRKKD